MVTQFESLVPPAEGDVKLSLVALLKAAEDARRINDRDRAIELIGTIYAMLDQQFSEQRAANDHAASAPRSIVAETARQVRSPSGSGPPEDGSRRVHEPDPAPDPIAERCPKQS